MRAYEARTASIILSAMAALAGVACTTISPQAPPTAAEPDAGSRDPTDAGKLAPQPHDQASFDHAPFDHAPFDHAPFDHAPFARVLARAVDDRGRVDYAGLERDPGELPAYFAAIARSSPDSAPARFPTREHELAYWINAYNAATMYLVLDAYPIGSVLEVRNPRALFFLPRPAGFFVFRRFELGEDATSLYFLENDIVRDRYAEPRIHFALNCASASCPRLPREPFLPERLEAQLEREARRFFAEPRNLEVDRDAQRVYLSAILDWYRDDYLDWLERERPELPRTLVAYAALYAPPEVARQLAAAADWEVVFRTYDWSLNDQALPDPFDPD